MVVTVTMNPAIDKTVFVDSFEYGGLNRIKSSESDVGGKGINVSKTIKSLGGKSVATGFIAGEAGNRIEKCLNEAGIETDFVKVEGETRTNTKIVDGKGELTELNEQGPCISSKKLSELLEIIRKYAKEDTLFVLAGSVPGGVPKDIYAKIIKEAHEKGAIVLMDADGDLFKEGLKEKPDIIKPNRAELESFLGIDHKADDEVLYSEGKKLLDQGIKKVVISMGKDGAMFLSENESYICPGLKVEANSAVGAGDAMVAALAYSFENGFNKEDTARLCMATSAGAVMTIGTKPPERSIVFELMEKVTIKKL